MRSTVAAEDSIRRLAMVGGVGEGKGRGSGEECWGQRGENNGVTKAALFRSCGRGKTGISQG